MQKGEDGIGIYDSNSIPFLFLLGEDYMEALVKIEQISFNYQKQSERVLDNVSLKIFPGDFLAIIGPNGSGKSTLAKMMNGLLIPTEGIVTVEDIQTTNSGELIWRIRSSVGMVFQNPENQIVANTVEEDVAFGLENLAVNSDEMRIRVDKALEKVGLENQGLAEPHYLSGGQKQKVAIAGILAMKPKMIIFDEATSMLDPLGKKEILSAIQKLVEEDKIAVVLITHSVQEAASAKRIIVIKEGKMLIEGTPEAILKKYPLLKEVGLSIPLTVDLAERLYNRGYNVNREILMAEEFVGEVWKLF